MTIHKCIFLLSLFYAATFVGCKNQYQAVNKDQDQRVIIPDSKVLSLADYLRRVPQLFIQGSGDSVSVQIRENSTITGSSSPLYVIDGKKSGRNYNTVSRLVDPNDIAYIKALTNASETSFYGIDGSSGVIIIKTK